MSVAAQRAKGLRDPMLSERRRRVLRALVEEYIASAVPVGSRTLVERYELGCSPATVRNELSILEETGYVIQPHVSAGRLPTDAGYRDFVDDLLAHLEEQEDEAREQVPVDALLHACEIDELMREASIALMRVTDYLAVAVAPSVSVARVKRIDLLSLAPRRALFVLITESGQVVNRAIELDREASPEALSAVERALNAAVVGKRARDIRPLREALESARSEAPSEARTEGQLDDADLMGRVLDEIIDALEEAWRDRLHHAGVPALLAQPEFHDAERARPLIEFLEDGIQLLEALSEALSSERLTVRIGHENLRSELEGVSIVASSYDAGSGEGLIGVVGPTRMDYERAVRAVRAVARELSSALRSQ